jgi:hypothetical protein
LKLLNLGDLSVSIPEVTMRDTGQMTIPRRSRS